MNLYIVFICVIILVILIIVAIKWYNAGVYSSCYWCSKSMWRYQHKQLTGHCDIIGGWDGKYNGELCSSGAYVYKIVYDNSTS